MIVTCKLDSEGKKVFTVKTFPDNVRAIPFEMLRGAEWKISLTPPHIF